jgi:exoribonuclease R
MLYKILFSNYSDYNVFNTTNFEKVVLNNFTPHHLFTNDIFSFENDVITVVQSTMRSESISGVLCLRDNKTYGRTKGGGEGRLLYKFIPDDKRIPPFVVPYDLKKVGFSKVFVNNYVVIQYKEWSGTHPQGIITVNIGPVNILDNFYEYQLYCKSLNASIQKFKRDTTNSLKDTTHDAVIKSVAQKYDILEDRTEWKVFTIDPLNTSDFDDGFSIVDGPESGTILLSVYITNVTLCMDFLNLWDSFSQRISTIYLPNKKRPMLPTVLSECLCSLITGQIRTAFTMDILIDASLYEIVEITYKNTQVKVHKNYVYEEYSLLENAQYQRLLDVTQQLSTTYKYMNNVRNSHDVVTYLMILMNYHSAKRMITFNNGIFRTAAFTKLRNVAETSPNTNAPEEILQFIKVWSSSSCQYVDVSKLGVDKNTNHDLLDMDAYIHVTSPIRRLVDLLNMMLFQKNTGMVVFSENADRFLEKWLGEIDYINSTMKTIRKVQNNCVLMDLCTNKPETLEKQYEGYLFDKLLRSDGIFQYVVYIPELKMTYRTNSPNEYEYCEKRMFSMFLFCDEDSLKKKIRLQIIG